MIPDSSSVIIGTEKGNIYIYNVNLLLNIIILHYKLNVNKDRKVRRLEVIT